MINFHHNTLLVVAPHPDDEVIGCGGLIKKIKETSGAVYVLFLTVGHTDDFSNHGHSNPKERVLEVKKVARMLGIDGWHIAFPGDIFHLKLDQLSQKSIIHAIERGEKISLEKIKPDILAFPMFGDYNQDHRAATEACIAACRPAPHEEKHIPTCILSYESPANSWTYPSVYQKVNFFVELTKSQFESKLEAMNLYESQLRMNNHPRHRDTLRALMELRGADIGVSYAEGYYCHKVRG